MRGNTNAALASRAQQLKRQRTVLSSPPLPRAHNLLPSSSSSLSSSSSSSMALEALHPWGKALWLTPGQRWEGAWAGQAAAIIPGTNSAISVVVQSWDGQAGISQNGTEHPQMGLSIPSPSSPVPISALPSPPEAAGSQNPQLPGVCVHTRVLQLGAHSAIPYLSRKKDKGLAGLLGFQLCRAAVGPVPRSAFAPGCSSISHPSAIPGKSELRDLSGPGYQHLQPQGIAQSPSPSPAHRYGGTLQAGIQLPHPHQLDGSTRCRRVTSHAGWDSMGKGGRVIFGSRHGGLPT